LRNLRSHLLSISSTAEFQKVVGKTIAAVRNAIHECNANEEVLYLSMERIQGHFTGNHDKCIHEISGVETVIVDPKWKQQYLVGICLYCFA
jgi:hypothetical protein